MLAYSITFERGRGAVVAHTACVKDRTNWAYAPDDFKPHKWNGCEVCGRELEDGPPPGPMTRDDIQTVLMWAADSVEQAERSDTADAASGGLALKRVADAFGFTLIGSTVRDDAH